MNITKYKEINQTLFNWYKKFKRNLPWRKSKDPYAIWVSEAMLQQTQVDTVIPYYLKWLQKYPTLQKLRKASLDDVLHLWEGLGYYTRARNLHRAAKYIEANLNSNLPKQYDLLLKIPGIGDYTASAILSIAFGQAYPALDGNAKRVYSRILLTHQQKKMYQEAKKIVEYGNPGHINQAIMDIGAKICTPKQPRCLLCPLSALCRAALKGKVEAYPKKMKRIRPKKISTVCIVIKKGQQYLVRQRTSDSLLGGLWEFPTYKIHDSINTKKSCEKILNSVFSKKIYLLSPIGIYQQTYTHLHETLYAFEGRTLDSFIKPKSKTWRWTSLKNSERFAWPRIQKNIWSDISHRT